MSRWKLQPRPNKDGTWRLNIPGSISATGKRQRLYFEKHWQALAAANNLRKHHDQFGLSSRMLSPSRLIEATECWDLIGADAPPGSMRKIVVKALEEQRQSAASITLDELFKQYAAKMERLGRTRNYLVQIGYARKAFDFWADTKLPQISPGNIEFSLKKIPSGARNAHLAILRALMGFAVKKNLLSKNPVAQLEFSSRPKVEIKPLGNELVAQMLRHGAEHEIELLPYLTIGFFCGCRESELGKILWSDVNLEDCHVMVRPEVSKTRRKRFPPIPHNALDWLKLYVATVGQPNPSDRILKAYTLATLRNAKRRNYREAGGIGHIARNAKRISFATAFISAYQDIDKLSLYLGHTRSDVSFEHCASNLLKSVALAYFDIKP